MELIGKLTGGVAHDFNNLLTVIYGYAELLSSSLDGADSRRDLLAEIHKAGVCGESLTRQLLAFSRKQPIEPKVVNLNDIVSDIQRLLQRLLGEDILLGMMLAEQARPVNVDAGQVQQVLLNLAVNARDAMPTGGTLTFETKNVTLDAIYALAHPDVLPGEYVCLAVRDTGIGMSPETFARIFEPLFTTKTTGKGTGLGLMMVKGIIQQIGGNIDVESSPGRGSTFKVYFPVAFEPLNIQSAPSLLKSLPRGAETVLLAEDEDSVRTLARHVLETCGYTVLCATHGHEALELVAAHPGPIDLLICDIILPHLDGRDLAVRLQALQPQARILLLSGYTNDTLERRGPMNPQHAFLQKPFTSSTLAQTVRSVLDTPVRVSA